MKIVVFQFKFHWNLFPSVLLQHATIGLDNGFVQIRRQAINWTNDGLVRWRIFAPFDELK